MGGQTPRFYPVPHTARSRRRGEPEGAASPLAGEVARRAGGNLLPACQGGGAKRRRGDTTSLLGSSDRWPNQEQRSHVSGLPPLAGEVARSAGGNLPPGSPGRRREAPEGRHDVSTRLVRPMAQ